MRGFDMDDEFGIPRHQPQQEKMFIEILKRIREYDIEEITNICNEFKLKKKLMKQAEERARERRKSEEEARRIKREAAKLELEKNSIENKP
jgi:hypothetical protein